MNKLFYPNKITYFISAINGNMNTVYSFDVLCFGYDPINEFCNTETGDLFLKEL